MSLFFPRGPGPLVSVLLPTRGRPDALYQAVGSLYVNTRDRGRVEYIFKLDDDDCKTIDLVEGMIRDGLPGRTMISPRGNGYLDMHLWVNQMAEMARGDWLFLWNDDARIATGAWDEILLHASVGSDATWHGVRDVCMFLAPTIGRSDSPEFGFLRRKVFEILGHYSLNPHTDNWIYSVVCFVHCVFRCPVEVEHLSGTDKFPKDQVRDEVLEAYKKAGRDLNSSLSMRQKHEDVKKLIDYIEAHREKR